MKEENRDGACSKKHGSTCKGANNSETWPDTLNAAWAGNLMLVGPSDTTTLPL
jgi:hypothetical protein